MLDESGIASIPGTFLNKTPSPGITPETPWLSKRVSGLQATSLYNYCSLCSLPIHSRAVLNSHRQIPLSQKFLLLVKAWHGSSTDHGHRVIGGFHLLSLMEMWTAKKKRPPGTRGCQSRIKRADKVLHTLCILK